MTVGGHTRLPRPNSWLCRTHTSPFSLSGNSAEANLFLVAVRKQRRGKPLPGRCPETAQRQTSSWSLSGNSAEANLFLVAVRKQRRGKPLPGRCPETAQRQTSSWSLSGNSAEVDLTLALPRTTFEANLTLVPSAGSEPRCATLVPEWGGLCRLPPDVRFSMSVGPRGAVLRAWLAECEPVRHSDAAKTADRWASRGPRSG